jgi:hypothetical protein
MRYLKFDVYLVPSFLWVAKGTQPLICARAGILLNGVSSKAIMKVAEEAQEILKQLTQETTTLKIIGIPTARH